METFQQIIDFLFGSMAGLGTLVGVGMVASFIAAVVLERKTRKQFVDRPKGEDDWSFFDDDDEDDEDDYDYDED